MPLRKQLFLMMFLLVFLTTGLYSFISGSYIDKYFTGFVQRQYEQQVDKISAYSLSLLGNESIDSETAVLNLKRYMEDPIIGVSIYDSKGTVVLAAEAESNGGMMRGKMMHRRFQIEEDQYALEQNGQLLGRLIIERNAAIQNSESVFLFKEALMMGSLISGGIILLLALAMVLWLSGKMTKDLNQTATFASALQSSDEDQVTVNITSNISEISAIQMSLKNLSSKLKLQQQVQKERADQLAHEARTPLTLLKTHVEGVMDGIIEMDKGRLESCLHQIDSLSQVIGNISNVISIEREQIPCQKVYFDLAIDLKKIVKAMKMVLSQKSIHLEMDLPNELFLESDPTLTSQILYNLLTNASKFTPVGGTIRVLASTEPLQISVQDTGPGIPEEAIDAIFQAYYRLPSARSIPGEGLGLYIAKRNAEAIGAKLYARNLENGGSSFVLEFPLD